jgi:RNA polymerase sigma-70 factor, ECF subfamily
MIERQIQAESNRNAKKREAVLSNTADSDNENRGLEAGDFDWIMQQHQKRIYHLLLAMTSNSDAAEQLTQECFLRAFKNSASFRGDAQVSTWLIRIAINLAHDYARSKRLMFWRGVHKVDRLESFAWRDGRRSQEQTFIDRERIEQLQAAIDRLPKKQRAVFLLRFVEEMPLDAISEVMDLEIGTVKSHLFRAVESVKKFYRKKKL